MRGFKGLVEAPWVLFTQGEIEARRLVDVLLALGFPRVRPVRGDSAFVAGKPRRRGRENHLHEGKKPCNAAEIASRLARMASRDKERPKSIRKTIDGWSVKVYDAAGTAHIYRYQYRVQAREGSFDDVVGQRGRIG